MIIVQMAEKALVDEVDYSLTFGGEGWGADTITTVAAVGENITVGTVTHDADTVTFWVSGGTAGVAGTVTITVETAGGRVYERRAIIPVEQ